MYSILLYAEDGKKLVVNLETMERAARLYWENCHNDKVREIRLFKLGGDNSSCKSLRHLVK